MGKNMKCLRCDREMTLIREEYLQLGKMGWFIGELGNLAAGALWVKIMGCPNCGKLEFFRGDWAQRPDGEEGIAQTTCPGCGKRHDMDDPKCPVCGMKNPIF